MGNLSQPLRKGPFIEVKRPFRVRQLEYSIVADAGLSCHAFVLRMRHTCVLVPALRTDCQFSLCCPHQIWFALWIKSGASSNRHE